VTVDIDGLRRLPLTHVRTVACGAELAESPLWLARSRTVVWVDAGAGTVHVLDVASGLVRAHRPGPDVLGGEVLSAVAAGRRDDLLLAAGRRLLRWDPRRPGPAATVAEIPAAPPGVRLNDAKVGPDGLLWAGTVVPGTDAAGALWTLTADGRVQRRSDGVTHGNGLGWSPSGRVFWFVDSGRGTLTRHGFDPAAGLTTAGEVVLALPRGSGIPDGLAVDAAGGVWLAVWGGGGLLRLDPDGRVLGRVDLPERNVTSCAFAGDALDLLVVTTAADGERSGSVHLFEAPVPGVPVARFGVRVASTVAAER
jgi:sugar lactone lactonase YvrE